MVQVPYVAIGDTPPTMAGSHMMVFRVEVNTGLVGL
jgi:hypothetical protein